MRKNRFIPTMDMLPSRIAPTGFGPPTGPIGDPTPPSGGMTATDPYTSPTPCPPPVDTAQ